MIFAVIHDFPGLNSEFPKFYNYPAAVVTLCRNTLSKWYSCKHTRGPALAEKLLSLLYVRETTHVLLANVHILAANEQSWWQSASDRKQTL